MPLQGLLKDKWSQQLLGLAPVFPDLSPLALSSKAPGWLS